MTPNRNGYSDFSLLPVSRNTTHPMTDQGYKQQLEQDWDFYEEHKEPETYELKGLKTSDPFTTTTYNLPNDSRTGLYHSYQEPFVTDPFQDPPSSEKRSGKFPPPTFFQKASKFPIFTYVVTVFDVIVFIVELVKMAQLTGSPIQTKPYFNPMIGLSTYAQIYIGSRFSPCMQYIDNITDLDINWPCPNTTTSSTEVCTLYELCNLSDDVATPNQSWRILSAMFLHAGFVHIIFNLLLQLSTGREVETKIGTIRYFILYMLSGISGNLFGLNFAGDGVSSTGASGALFGIICVNLILFLLFQDKRKIPRYNWILGLMVGEIVICLVLGLLPGLDNFAHIGGFVCGLLGGIVLLDNPHFVKIRPTRDSSQLFSFENIKKKQFWIWTAVRFVSLCLLVAWFVGLAMNFVKNGGGNCSWCKYLSCLPVNDWCSSNDLTTTATSQ